MTVTAGQPRDMTGIGQGVDIWCCCWARLAHPSLPSCPNSAYILRPDCQEARKEISRACWCRHRGRRLGPPRALRYLEPDTQLPAQSWNASDVLQDSLLTGVFWFPSPLPWARAPRMCSSHPPRDLLLFYEKRPRIICSQTKWIKHLSSPATVPWLHVYLRPFLKCTVSVSPLSLLSKETDSSSF